MSSIFRRPLRPIVAALVCAAFSPSDPLAAQEVPEVSLAKATAEIRGGLKSARSVYELRDGRLLIADALGGKLRVADLSAGAVEDRLSAGSEDDTFRAIGALWSWPADSVAFVDVAKGRLTILSPDGRFARAITLSEALAPTAAGQPAAARGPRLPALRYLVSPTLAIGAGFPPRVAPATGLAPPVRVPYPLVRFDIATASYDTIIQLMPPQQPRAFVLSQTVGTLSLFVGTESLQSVDAWAVLSDGTVVVVRAGGYRLDLIAPDRSRTQVGPIAFPKIPVTDGDRKRIMASYKAAMTAQIASNPRLAVVRSVEYEEPSTWPVTHPPFRGDVGARVDRRDQIWLSTRCAKQEQADCYDVISRAGERVMRVRLPDKTALLGFGKDAVYLAMEEKGDKLVVQRYALP